MHAVKTPHPSQNFTDHEHAEENMEEAFFTEDLLKLRPEHCKCDTRNRGNQPYSTHPVRVIDRVLVEEAINRVHEEHKCKCQHEEQS
ncbi:hypothetical protein D3C84_1026850 [compost metagenome]